MQDSKMLLVASSTSLTFEFALHVICSRAGVNLYI